MEKGRGKIVSIFHSPLSLLLLTLPAWLPLLFDPGLVNTRAGGDSPFLLQRVHQMSVALQAGHFPARWMPDAAFGFGYPFWNYYAPLAYYIAAGFHLAGLGIVNAIKLTQILGFLGAGAGMHLLANDIFDSRPAAGLATVAYTYAPFHLVNVYVRGDSLGEFGAFALYPLIFLGLRRLRANPGPGPTAFTALTYAGLILSHNISALIFTPFAIVYALLLPVIGLGPEQGTAESDDAIGNPVTSAELALEPEAKGSVQATSASSVQAVSEAEGAQYTRQPHGGYLLWAATALALGLALSAWYWAPALLEQDAVQLESNLTGYFHYAGHFRSANLVQRDLLFDFDVDAAGAPFAMGLVQAVLGLAGCLALVITSALRNRRCAIRNTVFFAGTALVATFLITPWSRPLWDNLPLLPFVQFPWRWLSVQAFGLSMVIGALTGLWPDERNHTIRYALTGGLALLIITTSMLHLRVEYLPVRDADVTPERLMLYEMFSGNIGSTVRAEYLPTAVNPRPWTSATLVQGRPALPLGATNAQVLRREPASQQWQVTMEQSGDVVFPLYWFPGWRATIDGQPAETSAEPNHGGIRVAVPTGTHAVSLSLGRTPTRLAAEVASALGMLVVLALVARRGLSAKELRAGALMAAALIAIGLALVTTSTVAGPLTGPLTMDFSNMPYLHPNPGGARFSDGARILDYELGTTELEAGHALDLTMRWEKPVPDARIEVALVSPAEVLFHVPAVIATARAGIEREASLDLHIPEHTTAGIYLPRLRIVNNGEKLAARTPNDAKIGDLYLQPVRIRPTIATGGQPSGSFADVAGLGSVEASRPSPEQLEVRMTWWAEQSIVANYATSVRLKSGAGETIAQADTQPCYGLCPTSTWEPNVPVYDRRWLALPAGTPPGRDYQLEVVLYEAASLAPLGTVQVNKISLTEISVRQEIAPRFLFSAGLAVADFVVGRETGEPGEVIPIRITWWLQKPVGRDLRARLLLLDETGEQIVHAEPAHPLATVPTSRWPLGAYVTQSYRVTLPRDLLPGQYQIAVGLEGTEEWFAPGITLQIDPSTRIFEPPELSRKLNIDFAGQIRLLGYDLQPATNGLSLLMAWQALMEIDQNYKTFLHLFDPATEEIAAQWDAEPRSGNRPTSTWIAGEVVTDGLHIMTVDLPPGAYRLATGLYDPATSERLPAVEPDGGRLPQDRVVLDETITVSPLTDSRP